MRPLLFSLFYLKADGDGCICYNSCMRNKVLIGGLIALWLLMWGVGWMIHSACAGAPMTQLGWVSIAGYDSEAYLNQACNINWLFSSSFRHPLMSLELSPIYILSATTADRLGPVAGKFCALGFFSLIGALTVLLLIVILRRLSLNGASRAAALALWLSFAHVWLLGGLAESFGPSQLLLLGVVVLLLHGVRDWRVWSALAAVSSGMTLTNGIKPLLVWMIGTKGAADRLRRLCTVAAVAAALAVVGAVVVMAKWVFLDKLGIVGGAQTIINDIAACFPQAEMTCGQRLWYAWHAFWCEPMMTHGAIIASDGPAAGYATYLPHAIAGVTLALCVASAAINFHRPIVKAVLAMVSVDFVLHVLLGWGATEGQIYCGHWFWCIPIFIALLPSKWPLLAFPLALAIAAHNIGLVL